MSFQLVYGAAGAAAAAGCLVFGGHVQYLLVQMSANRCLCLDEGCRRKGFVQYRTTYLRRGWIRDTHINVPKKKQS